MRTTFVGLLYFFICILFCSPLPAQGSPPTFLFLLEGKGVPTGTVHVFSVSTSTGGITEVPGSPFNAGLLPNQLVVDPTGRFVYVTNEQSQDITAFSVDAVTGALTQLPGSPVLIGAQPITSAVDPTGRFLYVFATTTLYGSEQEVLYEYTIDPVAGVLTLTTDSPSTWEWQQGFLISSITFDAAGNYAYLGQVASGVWGAPTLICAVDFGSGNLSIAGSVQPANNGEANFIAASTTGLFLYSINSTGNVANAFTMGALGATLTENPGSPYTVPNSPASIFVHPSGNFLYVANENQIYQTTEQPSQYTGSISGFSMNSASGTLTPVPGSPFASGINPVSIVVDPSGRYAYSASTVYAGGYSGFAQIMGFSINSTSGALTPFGSPAFTDSANSNGAQLAVSLGSVVTNPVPMIASLNPPASVATGTPFVLQVNGANFAPGAAVYFAGQVRSTTFVSSTQVNVNILGSDIANDGNVLVFVFNPLPGGGASTSVEFPVSAFAPVLSSTQPSSVTAMPIPIGFYAIGSNFTSGSVINFNGTPITTLYFGSTILFGITAPGDVATPGIGTIVVTTPSNGVPGGGTSNPVALSIVAPVPQLSVSNISPASALAGGQGFLLTVSGNGFVQGSQVSFNLFNVPTTLVSSSVLIASIPASSIAIAGNPYVIVTNPGGATSSALTFTVSNPPPGSGTITPQNVPPGSNALTLSVTGTNFTPNSVVLVNGGARPTTYMNSKLMLATLLPADLKQTATLNISVSTPPPGGGTTAAVALTVADYSVSVGSSTQITSAGSVANFDLTLVAETGSFSHAIVFTASGVPPGATASFTPASVPEGSGSANVMFSVATASRSSGSRIRFSPSGWPSWPIFVGLLFALSVMWTWFYGQSGRMRSASPLFFAGLLFVISLELTACGSMVISSAPQGDTGTPVGTYTIHVAATSGSVTIQSQMTLTIM